MIESGDTIVFFFLVNDETRENFGRGERGSFRNCKGSDRVARPVLDDL